MTSLLKEIWLNSTHLYILLAVWLTQQGLLGLRELSFILHFCYESGLKIFVLVLFLPYLSLKCPFILKNALQFCTVYNGCLFEGIVPAGENWRTFCLVTPLGGMPGRSEGSAELYSWQMGEVYPHTMSELSSNHTPTFSYLLCQQGRKAVSFHFLHFLLSVPSLIMVNQQQVYYPQRPPSSNFFFFWGGGYQQWCEQYFQGLTAFKPEQPTFNFSNIPPLSSLPHRLYYLSFYSHEGAWLFAFHSLMFPMSPVTYHNIFIHFLIHTYILLHTTWLRVVLPPSTFYKYYNILMPQGPSGPETHPHSLRIL